MVSLQIFVLTSCITSILATDGLKIAAFNVQNFGEIKMNNTQVVEVLVQIVRRYDLILIQEVKDISGTAVSALLTEVNRNFHCRYNITLSEPIGGNVKEQYAFIYRMDTVTVKDTLQFPDPTDIFEREPYSVLFHSPSTDVEEFVLLAFHAQHTNAVVELNNLTLVHENAKSFWNNTNILILGDLNADCNYVTQSEMVHLLLRKPVFCWWINDNMDTTLLSSSCAYDRLIMTGTQFISTVVKNSAGVFHFDEEYGLTHTQALAVSDHYPVELCLKPKLSSDVSTSTRTNSGCHQSDVYKIIIRLLFALGWVYSCSVFSSSN